MVIVRGSFLVRSYLTIRHKLSTPSCSEIVTDKSSAYYYSSLVFTVDSAELNQVEWQSILIFGEFPALDYCIKNWQISLLEEPTDCC